MSIPYPKRLIEVDLPIKRISAHARREKSIRHGHISTLHIWWARRPLAACRAVICAALWPDPVDENCPVAFRDAARQWMLKWTEIGWTALLSGENQGKFIRIQKDPTILDDAVNLRQALLDFIADFANWDNSTKKEYLETSRALTQAAHEALGGVPGTRPLVVDPFAGGGAIPLEALRVGADAFASDLNPLPVLLNKLVLEYIPSHGAYLAEQVRKSGQRVRDKLKEMMQKFYTSSEYDEVPHAFFWARTIVCEGPSCGYTFPLIRSLYLRKKDKNIVALSVLPNHSQKKIDISIITDRNLKVGNGTSKQGAATCPVCGYTTPVEKVRLQLAQRSGGTIDAQLLVIAKNKHGTIGKVYRTPTQDELLRYSHACEEYLRMQNKDDEQLSLIPQEELNHLRGFFNVILYGMKKWGDLFNPRQALLMVNLTRLIQEEYQILLSTNPDIAEAVVTCLTLSAGKLAQYNSSCCRWKAKGETLVDMFGRQAIPMVWDFAEAYPFSGSTGDYGQYLESFCRTLDHLTSIVWCRGSVQRSTATQHPLPDDGVEAFITDPPYYDAIPYADLSDYFYVWFKRMLGRVHDSLFKDALSPKDDECVTLAHRAAMYRHKDRDFFERTMALAMLEGRRITKPEGIGVVVFANKSTAGWEAMLSALFDSGWTISASWPLDTEMESRLRARNSAVLASSVHIVCRPRENPDGTLKQLIGDWRDVLQELPQRIHSWMPRLASEGVVGADAIFACLGPALEVFSRYSSVEKASGEQVTLREYLEYVWAAVSKEALSMIFQDADATGLEEDARLTAMWLWTLSTGADSESTGTSAEEDDQDDDDDEKGTSSKAGGFTLEYDTARKIAQGLGANLETLRTIVEIKGNKARLLPVQERLRYLMGKGEAIAPTKCKKKGQEQLALPGILPEVEEKESVEGAIQADTIGKTALDRIHQSMLLFASGRSEALKRFLVDDGVGQDDRFWKLAQSLSALYPPHTDEKRWVDGVLARKKGLGF